MEEPNCLGRGDTVRSKLVEDEGGVGERMEVEGEVSQTRVDGGGEVRAPLEEESEVSDESHDRGEGGLTGGTDREQLRDNTENNRRLFSLSGSSQSQSDYLQVCRDQLSEQV